MKYFAVRELVDKATYELMEDNALKLFKPQALDALENLREFFGKNITVNDWSWGGQMQWRGYRTPAKATELGFPHSQHAKGNAFDCSIQGYTAEEARAIIVAHQNDVLLQTIMRLEDGVSWVHFDLATPPPGSQRIYLFKS
jgi:hypothetical protein